MNSKIKVINSIKNSVEGAETRSLCIMLLLKATGTFCQCMRVFSVG